MCISVVSVIGLLFYQNSIYLCKICVKCHTSYKSIILVYGATGFIFPKNVHYLYGICFICSSMQYTIIYYVKYVICSSIAAVRIYQRRAKCIGDVLQRVADKLYFYHPTRGGSRILIVNLIIHRKRSKVCDRADNIIILSADKIKHFTYNSHFTYYNLQ